MPSARLGAGALLALAAADPHLRLHLHFHGPAIDYVGVALGAVVSGLGLPGPGESLLIAGAIAAAHDKVAILPLLIVAFGGAMVGTMVGWVIGVKAGRALLTGRGPLRAFRRAVLRRGEEVFARAPVLAIVLTPPFVAGMHRARLSLFIVISVITSVLWAVGVGLGGYYAGPPIVDAVNDLGWVMGGALAALILAVVGVELWRRHQRARRDGPLA